MPASREIKTTPKAGLAGYSRVVAAILLLSLSLVTHAQPAPTYAVASHEDYVVATGCDVSRSIYNHAMRAALDYLVLVDEEQDIRYARRHSRDFFAPLLEGQPGQACLTPSLRRIAAELGFPEDGAALRAADAPEPVKALAVLTRKAYMDATACLASPSSWRHYQQAFLGIVLRDGDGERARRNLRRFLQQLGEGRSMDKGRFLEASCLVPALARLARQAGVLDARGRFALH